MRARARAQQGQAMVEFALIFTALMFIILGLVDVTRAIWYYNTLAHAVRDGARNAIVHGNDCSQASTWGLTACTAVGPTANDATVESTVRNRALGLEASSVAVTSTWVNDNNRPGSAVEVSATYNFTPIVGTFVVGGATVPLSATSRMTIVY